VPIIGDTLNEGNETFFLTLSSPNNALISDSQGIGTIVDDDPLPTLSINDTSVVEGDGGTKSAVFTVLLSSTAGQTVSVNYLTENGSATAPADFGTPLTTTSYQLCVYDASGNTVAHASFPAAVNCGGEPCWRVHGTKTTFRSSTLGLTLKAGGVGKARIVARGRGPLLGMRTLPAEQPLTVQLKNSEGVCWETVYSAPARRNEAGQFRDQAD
jgi:hypothetical protein